MAEDFARAELTEQSKHSLAKMRRVNMIRDLRRELILATAGIIPAVRQSARGLPSKRKRVGAKAGSLRSALAMAIKRKIKLRQRNAQMVVITSVPSGGKANLARAVEGDIPWHHPVYGHNPTVDQEHMPFFYEAVAKFAPVVEARVRKVFNDFEKKV